jgi:hypothetical protein
MTGIPAWRRVRLASAFFMMAVGVILLVGCIYLPIPEHGTDWSKKDFRPFISGGDPNSPIRRGITTRAQIIKLLGKPYFEIAETRAIVYKYNTARDFVIWPLCFIAQPGYHDSFAVKFDFDAGGTLLDWETAHESGRHYGGGAIQSPVLTYGDATRRFRPGYVDEDQTQPASTQPVGQ